MQLGPAASSALRRSLFEALLQGTTQQAVVTQCLVPQREARFTLPAKIGDYTDFFISIHHATAVGRLFRPDNPLLPNYKWVPIGYHGRASSIAVSGQAFNRPHGQLMPPGATSPSLAASRRLDYELEVGMIIGEGNA